MPPARLSRPERGGERELRRQAGLFAVGAEPVKIEIMIGEVKPFLQGNTALPPLNLFVVELFNPAALDANQMIMVIVRRQFENRVAPFKMVTNDKSGVFKLG